MATKADSVPRWLIGLIIVFATAVGYVGQLAVANSATLGERSTQLQDIRIRLIRIEAKLDGLEK